MNPKDWPDETRIDIIGANGGDGAHYPKIPKASWRDHWCRMLKERGFDGPEYCKGCEDD